MMLKFEGQGSGDRWRGLSIGSHVARELMKLGMEPPWSWTT